ncbi:MAG: lysine biosynthesis protein LysX [Candidatus Dormibacteria bacterium]
MSRPRVGLVWTRVRAEEKLLLEVLRRRGVELVSISDRQLQLPILGPQPLSGCAVVLLRCLGHAQQLALARVCQGQGIRTVNAAAVIEICDDKLATSVALAAAAVPTPRTRVAFSLEAALEAVEELGYPCVVKPVLGSWGRLVGRLNDRDAAEAVLEHKFQLGGSLHRVAYLQAHVQKPGRDLRAFFVGGRTVAAIGRRSAHWITNTARGATAEAVTVTEAMDDLCRRAAAAVGGGALAIDLLETGDGGLLVNEVNATMEFRNSIAPTGVDIAAELVAHALAEAGAT